MVPEASLREYLHVTYKTSEVEFSIVNDKCCIFSKLVI